MNAIQISGLTKAFGEKKVLKEVELQMKEGEIFGLLGPSGAGKTTLINIMTGQMKPTTGECKVLSKNSAEMKAEDYKKIGIMMDSVGLYDRMSCFENLKFYQMLDGNKTDGIMELLESVGLGNDGKTPVSKLSKGMKNRLSFARAILRKPDILFLDEPTSGLDPMTIEAIHERILEEKKKGTSIFLTTHNMQEAEKLCDHIALLNEGKIVEYGAPKEICRRYNHQKKIHIYLTDGEEVELSLSEESGEKITKYLKAGVLETIHSTEPDLETVFMELTGKELDK